MIGEENTNLGVLSLEEALKQAREQDLDLIEISPLADPPVAKIMSYGKFQYEQNKKQKKAKAGAKATETKSIQIKIRTGEHDLEMNAKTISKWLKEGHRIKIELYLSGRTKYMAENFLRERLDRILHLITEEYHVAEPHKKGPKGLALVIERGK